MRSWKGPADVNLTINVSYYSFNTSTFVGPTGKTYEEHGNDTTTTGETAAQGVVKFFRYRSQDDPRKTTCRVEVDAASDWRDRPELKVWKTGRSWSKSIWPNTPPGNWDKAVEEQETLAPTFVGVSFDCDPKAVSYSGQQDTWKGSPTSSQVVTWNISQRPSNTRPTQNHGGGGNRCNQMPDVWRPATA